MDTAPAIGTAVRFREDFGPVGEARTIFTVHTEPSWDNTLDQPLQVVGLKLRDKRGRAGHRLAYVRDLIPA